MIGSRIGEWQIERELGRGEFGVVYLAVHLDRPSHRVAVKLLDHRKAADPVFRFRFQAEVEVLGQLDHPNVVRYVGSGLADDGTPYLVTEYVEGRDLESVLQERHALPWPEMLDVSQRIAAGLRHAHQRGILHLDLKPANVLVPVGLDPSVVKILDFGLAALFGREAQAEPGTVVGSLAYLPPERITGKPTTKRSDVYSLGGLLYTMVAGRPPFLGANAVEILHRHCFTQPERPARLVPDLPHDIDDLIVRMLEKDPAKRPGDAGVVLKELERIGGKLRRQGKYEPDSRGVSVAAAETEFVPPEMADPPKPLMSRPAVVLPLFLLVVGLLVGGVLYTRARPGAEELYASAAPLLESDDPENWERAWDEYLSRLADDFPSARSEEVAAAREKVDDLRAIRKAIVAGKLPENTIRNQAERHFRRGLGLCRAGDFDAAARTWERLAVAFDGQESAAHWVRMARVGLDLVRDETGRRGRDFDPIVEAALARVSRLREEGRDEEAGAAAAALSELHAGDPIAEILNQRIHE